MKIKVVLLVLVALFVFATPAFALQDSPPTLPSVPDAIVLAGAVFANLIGIPGAIAALGNILKRVGIMKDGVAPYYNFITQLVIYVGVFVAVLTGNTNLLNSIDSQFVGVTKVLVDILILLGSGAVSMFLSGEYHRKLVKNSVPLLGFSYTNSR